MPDTTPDATADTTAEDEVLMEAAPVPVSNEDVRKWVRACADAKREAEAALSIANQNYQEACRAEARRSQAKVSLSELNEIQRRVTRTEDNRKARAMTALGQLGFGQNTVKKPHPKLF